MLKPKMMKVALCGTIATGIVSSLEVTKPSQANAAVEKKYLEPSKRTKRQNIESINHSMNIESPVFHGLNSFTIEVLDVNPDGSVKTADIKSLLGVSTSLPGSLFTTDKLKDLNENQKTQLYRLHENIKKLNTLEEENPGISNKIFQGVAEYIKATTLTMLALNITPDELAKSILKSINIVEPKLYSDYIQTWTKCAHYAHQVIHGK
ncbi:hypothetical protein [Bacillus cereus]|uniref:hypothetical protein n=1 Tax=Bacillus cereus TaxID=1396 RepID=UPI00397F1381